MLDFFVNIFHPKVVRNTVKGGVNSSIFVKLLLNTSFFFGFIAILGVSQEAYQYEVMLAGSLSVLNLIPLLFFKYSGNRKVAGVMFVFFLFLVVALQKFPSPLSSNLSYLSVPVALSLSVFVLGLKNGLKMFFILLPILMWEEMNKRFLFIGLDKDKIFDASESNIFYECLILILSSFVVYHVVSLIIEVYENQRMQVESREKKTIKILESNNLLLGIITKDIKRPLEKIAVSTSQLDSLLHEKKSDLADKSSAIKKNIKNMEHIISNVRSMVSREGESWEVSAKKTDLDDCLAEAICLLGAKAKKKSIEIRVQGFDEAEKTMVLADPVILSLDVIPNLLSNAIKFSHKGSIVYIQLLKSDDDNVRLAVKDSGIGIPSDLQPYIFSPHHPTSRKGTGGESGSGFGMPIVKQFMEAIGGDISIASGEKGTFKKNRGTTFILTFKKAA